MTRPRFRFGRHVGAALDAVPLGYLRWFIRVTEKNCQDPELRAAVLEELEERKQKVKAARAARLKPRENPAREHWRDPMGRN